MPVLAAYMVPHPPLIVPAIGQGSERQVDATCRAYVQAAKEIAELKPETIILSSPHAEMYADYFHISPGRAAEGSFGRFGAPRLGVVGAAWGTIIASCVNLAIIVLYAVVNRLPYIFEFGRIFRFSGAFVREYLVKCFPILMNEMAMGVSNMLINIVLGRQTAEAIAAVAIYRTIEGVVISFFSGFSSAASILVGKAVGAGQHEEAYRNAFRIIYFTSLGIAVTGAVIMMLHGPLFTVMGLSGESFEICTFLCGYYLLVAVIRMGNWQQNDVFRAGGDPAFGSIMEITFMYLMVIPLVYKNETSAWDPNVIAGYDYYYDPGYTLVQNVHLA